MASVSKRIKPRKSWFAPGETHTIYQRPISQEDEEGRAKLIKCLRIYTEFRYPGLAVEEWDVEFPDEAGTTRKRTVTARIIGVRF